LPNSVVSALDIDSPDHPDIPWQPPVGARRPPLGDLQAALKTLQDRMRPADDTLLAACFAKLVAVFEPPGTKLGAADLRLRIEAWRDLTRDIPADLFQTGIETCCASLKWMPKPVELREAIGEQLARRTKAIRRLEQMIAAAGRPVGAFVPEPLEVRLRAMRDSFQRIGNLVKAGRYERELADLENRAPADWAPVGASAAPPESAPAAPPPGPSDRRAAELAKAFHAAQKPPEKPPE
jgi:hypothetical protein